MRGKVLVLGQDNAVFLSVVRSLGRQGLEVHVAWYPEACATLASRHVARAHELLPPSSDGPWLEELITFLDRERFELVIPVAERAIHPLQKHRRVLEQHAKLALLDDEVYEVAFDKAKTYALAERCGVRVPRQVVVTRAEDAERLLAEMAFPIVLKPRSSYTLGASSERRRNVAKAFDRSQLTEHLARMLEDGGEVLAQENFVGYGAGVEVICDRGEVLFAFQHRRVHEPLHGGGSTYRMSCPVSPTLREASEKLMRALGYTGVAMVEFKVAPDSGTWVFLEINSRFWGSLPLAVAAGADFPFWLYQLLAEGRRDFPQSYAKGVTSRNLIGDLKWFYQNLRADKHDPTLATRPLPAIAGELAQVVTMKEHLDTFALDDPRPLATEVGYYLSIYGGKVIDRVNARVSKLSLLRSRRRERARRALSGAKSVLFLCKGNICRSPFAHAVLASLRPDLAVSSAGFYRVNGRRSPAEALRASAELGFPLEPHRSHVVNAAMVRDADVVFAFDEENLRAMREHFPWAMWKTHRFSSLEDAGPVEVEDPFGSELASYLACYTRIAGVLRRST